MNRLLPLLVLALGFTVSAPAQVYWTSQSPAGISDDIWCVTYANGTFAAVTNQGNLLTSSDGLVWSSRAIDPGVWLVSIAYGNGTWVAVGDGGAILASTDLKTWVNAKSVTTSKLNGVIYNAAPALNPANAGQVSSAQLASTWVAVGENGTVVTSFDALNWTLQPALPGVTGYLHGLAIIEYFPAEISVATDNAFLACGAGGVFLTGSPSGSFTPFLPVSSFDSVTSNLEAVVVGPIITVAVGQGAILYGGATAGAGALSPPTFTAIAMPLPNVDFRGLVYGNGYFVAAGEQGYIYRSLDGVIWTQSFSGNSPATLTTATLLSAAYSDVLKRFVITGVGGTILVSDTAPSVLGNVSTRGYVSPTQNFIGGFVIEGSAPRNVLVRADGPVLGAFGVPSPLADPVLNVYDSKGNLVASNVSWSTSANAPALAAAAVATGAFALPATSADSALLLSLPPGSYTAVITSASNGSGSALFEAYTY